MSIVEEGDRQPGNPTVLRVGAHLAWGDPNDPFPYTALRNARRVRSVLVEPEPVAHEQLRLLIATSNLSNVAAVNAAVCASDARGGKVTFYSRRGGVENSSLPQFASLNKQHVLDHLKRGGHRWRPSAHLQELEVACASVATTLDRLGVATEDLLLMTVDAEGSDLDIVRAAPWGRDFLPRLLLFEHRHIVRQPGGLEQTRAFLSALRANHSYRCEDTLDEENVYCVHERAAPLAGCSAMWSRSGPQWPTERWMLTLRSDSSHGDATRQLGRTPLAQSSSAAAVPRTPPEPSAGRPPLGAAQASATTSQPRDASLGATREGAATCRGAYTTFVSGVNYVPGVQCLLRNRAQVGSNCPWVVVYDDRDRPSTALPRRVLRSLSLMMTRLGDELVALSSLFGRLGGNASLQHDAFTGVVCEDAVPASAGRRLYERSEYTTPWLKLWLWALPHEYLLYVDCDVLLTRSLDALLREPPRVLASGDVGLLAMPAASCPKQASFNSGVVLFRPSLEALAALQRLAATWARRMVTLGGKWKPPKACERRVGDQSILNFFYRASGRAGRLGWAPLPAWVRVRPASLWANEQALAAGSHAGASTPQKRSDPEPPAVLHFLAEPKPWAMRSNGTSGQDAQALALWTRSCGVLGSHAPEPPTAHQEDPGAASQAAPSRGKEGQPCGDQCVDTTAPAGGPCAHHCGTGWLCCRKDFPSLNNTCSQALSLFRARFKQPDLPRGWLCVDPSVRPPPCRRSP